MDGKDIKASQHRIVGIELLLFAYYPVYSFLDEDSGRNGVGTNIEQSDFPNIPTCHHFISFK